MTKDYGRVPTAPGSREPSPDGLGPTGFDPSRGYVVADEVPSVDYITPGKAYPVQHLMFGGSVFVIEDDEGDQIHCLWKDCAHLDGLDWRPITSDSDGSPKGGDACGSVEDDSAVPERQSPEGSQS